MIAVWNKPLQIYLAALITIQILPLFAIVPTWVYLMSITLIAWKVLALWKGIRIPSRKWISVLSALGLVGVWVTKRTLLGEDAATAGLAIIAGCKLLETNRYRDVMMAIVLCFLLLMVQLLFNQGLGTLIFLIVDVLLLVQLLLQLHPSDNALLSFKVVGKLVMMVVPIWIMLFFVFPRFTVGFWRREVPSVTSGFSEDMNPGMISQLVQTEEVAFRLKFEGLEPKPSDVYIRGAVLGTTDGLHWIKPQRTLPTEDWDKSDQDDRGYKYQLYLEPFFQRWLFTLDYFDPGRPVELAEHRVVAKNGGTAESVDPITSRIAYSGFSSQKPLRINKLSEAERLAYIQLPPDLDRRIYDLAFDLRSSNASEVLSVTNMVNWFTNNKFLYSLKPGQTDDLSSFLFDTHVGFCEHYSAAAAVLLRAMGFPARVVVGFQGAEKNPLGDYWIVRNRNAHAWAEVWVQGPTYGFWQRVDLTSFIAPARISLGADYYALAAQYAGNVDPSAVRNADHTPWEKFRNRIRLAGDAFEMQWVRFLLNYDFKFQQRLISRFGIENASRFTLVILVVGALALAFLILMWVLQRKEKKIDPVLKEWRRFCEQLARKGVTRKSNEGPLDFITRAQAALPAQSADLQEIGSRFLALRYGDTPVDAIAEALDRFKLAVRRLK